MRGYLLFALALGGCIESRLVPCGSIACPVGLTCAAFDGEPTCVDPAQLTVCVGVADGESCTYARITDGSCEREVCLPRACGNDIKTSDEICDDGNNVNGDGCAADCLSDETCGNANVDPREQCDDGNSDDADACRNTCLLPRCGDGTLDSSEECEPGGALALTCEDLGYYDGDLQCGTTCRFNPVDSCIGRCGDGDVQTNEGEECDGAPPQQSCVDLNYDFGAATCTSSCSVASCQRFGWTRLRDLFYQDLVAGDAGRLIVRREGYVEVQTAAGWLRLDGAYTAVDMRGTQALAATQTVVELFDGASWTMLPAPTLNGLTITEARLGADDGTPTILACGGGAQCSVLQYAAATGWTAWAHPSPAQKLTVRGAANYAIASGSLVIWRYSATETRTENVGGPPVSIDLLDNNAARVYAAIGNQISGVYFGPTGPGTIAVTTLSGSYASIAVIGDFIYALDNAYFNSPMYRAYGTRVEIAAGPPEFSAIPFQPIVATHDGRVLVISDGGLWEPSALLPTTRQPPTTQQPMLVPYTRLADLGGDVIGVCETDVWITNAATYTKLSTQSGSSCRGMWGTPSLFYVSRQAVNGVPSSIYRYASGTWTEEMYQSARIDAQQLTGEDTTVVALLLNGTILRRTSDWAALPALPSGCTAKSVAMRGGAVHVGGSCSGAGKIWRLDGSSWTELYSDSMAAVGFASLVLNADGSIFAAGDNRRVVAFYGGTWRGFAGLGYRLAGTSATDMFAIGIGPGGPLSHWDGTTWSPIRIDSTHQAGLVFVGGTKDVVVLSSPFPNPTPLRWNGFLRDFF